MFFFNNYVYYITIALQLICVVHCLRKGTQTTWIWLIIFVPLVGCIAYIIMEVFNRNSMQQMQTGVGSMINPAGGIRKLEKQLEFADTFNNRVQLADAYLSSGNTEKAISLYETSLNGAFKENEHVLIQLAVAYYNVQRYNDAIKAALKVYSNPAFMRTHAHVIYAMALDKAGDYNAAEKEFNLMKGKYSYFEARYQYATFLVTKKRTDEAKLILNDIINEFGYLSSFEKRNNRPWYNYAKQEMKKINLPSTVN